jgi:hypothetical protein
MSKRRSPKQAAGCVICGAINDRSYPTCADCELLRHFFDRPCRCESCTDPNCFPAAVRERFPGLVLVATSDDPPELRRFEFTLDAIKPEYRLEIAKGLCEMIRAA